MRSHPVHVEYALTVPHDQIWYVSWTFDASDGVALLRNDRSASGSVTLLLPEERLQDAEMIIDGLIASGIPIVRGEIRRSS